MEILEADAHLLGQRPHRRVEGLGHVRQRDGLVGADHPERPFLEFEVAFGCFHQRRRHRLGLLDNGVGRDLERIAADHHAARAIGAAADLHLRGVALHVADLLERNA